MSQRPTSRVRKRQQYVRNACAQCKKRKVKCSGEPCCQQCLTHNVQCTYEGASFPGDDVSSQVSMRYRTLRLELQRLRLSMDGVLKDLNECRRLPPSHEKELDDLLLQTTQRIEACRIALIGKQTANLQLDAPENGASSRWDESRTSFSFDPEESPALTDIPPLPISKDEALELIQYFRFETENFYPFIPFQCLSALAMRVLDSPGGTRTYTTGIETDNWGDGLDIRNVDLLGLLLACASASKFKGETSLSLQLSTAASDKLLVKANGPKPDAKDIAMATLLCIYHIICDETVLAWRKINVAVRMCQELGFHQSLAGQPVWVSVMFWCIYVLDKRLSLMASVPFSMHDSDIEHQPPSNVHPLQYLVSQIQYVRLAAKFVPKLPRFGTSFQPLPASACDTLDLETDHWAISSPVAWSIGKSRETLTGTTSQQSEEDQFGNAWVTVLRNQLKLGLFKHNLFTQSTITQNPELSLKAVAYGSDTIQCCNRLKANTSMYELQAVHLNFFVLSAAATLYLAVRHVPLLFGTAHEDLFTGLTILKPYGRLDRLSEHVRALEGSLKKLGYDPRGIGPQLYAKDTGMPSASAQQRMQDRQQKQQQQAQVSPQRRFLDDEGWLREYDRDGLVEINHGQFEATLMSQRFQPMEPGMVEDLGDLGWIDETMESESGFLAQQQRHQQQWLPHDNLPNIL